MKFTNGYWMNLPGVNATNVVQIREVKKEGNKIYLYTVGYSQDYRAMGGPIVELYISSPKKDFIRVQAQHFIGSRVKRPEYELDIEDLPVDFSEGENSISISSGDTRLEIQKRPAKFVFYYKNKKLTSVGDRFGQAMISYMSTNEGSFMRTQLDLDIGEKVYGLGERFTPFVKNGQTVDMWNEDGGTNTQISYKNIPFYVTNRGYGVFVNDSGPVSFEASTECVTRVQFSVPGDKLDFMIIGADDMKGVISKYTAFTGRPSLPPAWTFGLWLSSSFETSYDEKTVNEFVDGMKERDIPLSVFHFDCFWMRENEWCNFNWDEKVFSDPVGMLSRLKKKGLRICVWINPYIGQKSPLFKEAMDNGYFINRENGDVWQWDMWQAGLAIVDFTNPDACKWYKSKLTHLLEQGVDCFKTDFGERIPTDSKFFDGAEPLRMHNYYTYLYNKCVFEAIEEYKGKGNGVVFARSATVGGQKFPVHWGGDCSSNYASMAESLRGGLSLCLSGFAYWSHDISGFEGTASADVYKRWVAFGLLSTHSRLHGSSSYRVPWLFCKEGEKNGEESVAVTRQFAKLKCSLMPYLYSNAALAYKEGVPVMRAMVLEFGNDFTCEDLDRQYMLGDSILVAPVMRESGEVDYYLPKGTWTHLLSNEVREGGAWQKDTYDFFSLPLYVRENTVLPIGANENSPEYDYADGITLNIFALKTEASRVVYDMNGKEVLKVNAKRSGDEITVSLSTLPKNAKVLLRNIASVKNVVGATASSDKNGTLLTLTDKNIKVTL